MADPVILAVIIGRWNAKVRPMYERDLWNSRKFWTLCNAAWDWPNIHNDQTSTLERFNNNIGRTVFIISLECDSNNGKAVML